MPWWSPDRLKEWLTRTPTGPWAGSKDHPVDVESAREPLDVAREVQALGITSDEFHPVKGVGFVSARVMPHDIAEDAMLEPDTPAVRATNTLLREALLSRASDIHLEDSRTGLRLRYRVDGILRDLEPLPDDLRAAIMARLRVMAGLNLTEHRLPQDGRMRVHFKGAAIDMRVSTVPLLNGESVVVRLLDPSRALIEVEDLGLSPRAFQTLLDVIARPNGMILATGPGGSGKSTTLHSIARRLSTGREKILTVEDPVEAEIENMCQVQVNERVGLTFPVILRTLVRQDPDVLLVGEIRDEETAEIAVHTALTGHLVLSTLHTIDAVSALPRLLNLGVPDYLITTTIEAVIGQRLVRKVCEHCAQEVEYGEGELGALGPAAQTLTSGRSGEGCEECEHTGYRGRVGLYEVLRLSDPIREAFLRRAGIRELRTVASEEGMRALREDGVGKIRAGITTPDEVLRVT
jgi:type II secretory ATPase GspE/PulE/Tfp pilus assembly ATPase PilB-like protein